jgi:hypothetical protein
LISRAIPALFHRFSPSTSLPYRHAHEHLGQSIAYARMNRVVPPWTAAAHAKMRQRKPE